MLVSTYPSVAQATKLIRPVAEAQSLLSPLGSSLSALLLSLELVVNNLLAVVQEIVDSLLTGLSIGLAGLFL